MKLKSDFTVKDVPALTVEVDPRLSMNFAASIGDSNSRYFDDEELDGFIAPPMQAVALTWPLALAYSAAMRKHGYEGVVRRQVHYTEHVAWSRPIRPGETLVITVSGAALLSHGAGTYGLLRFEARDAGGDVVFVEHSGAIFRGVRLEGDSMGSENVPQVPAWKDDSAPLWAQPIHIDPLAAHVYDGCTDLHFPIHTSRRFAHKVGLPDPIVQGTCTLAMAVRELVNREAGADPTRLKTLSCRFTGMVFPGTDIVVRLLGASEEDGARRLFFDVLNTDGRKAISEGYLAIT